MLRAPFSLLFAVVLYAQDASLVLRTWVGYNSMANTVELTPEKKAEIVSLGAQARAESAAGRHGEAMKMLHRGMAMMRGIEWTPAASLAASLAPLVDHAVWEPGQKVQVRLKRYYAPDPGAPETIKGQLRLRPIRGEPIALGSFTGETTTIVAPEAAGVYRLELIALPLTQPKNVDVAVAPGVAKQAAALGARVSKLKAPQGPGAWTARYIAELFSRADRSEISPVLDFARELSFGESLVADLEAGRDPFRGRTGDMRRAYLSTVDNTLQPYRLYVPPSYKGDKPNPLVVALHGMGGDENSMFDGYKSRMLQDQADKYGWLLVAPKGRDSASMYRGMAEQDVLDVIAQVRSACNVDANRIYATGHSMGGFGSWSIAISRPDLFAALAPVAGGGNPSDMAKIRHTPQIIVHGDNDRTVNVSSSRNMVEAAKKLGVDLKYIEVARGGHAEVFVPAMPQVFEFFAAHAKREAAAATSGQ